MRFTWSYIRKYPKLLLLNLLGALAFTAVTLGLPTILGQVIDEVLINDQHHRLMFWVGSIVALGIFGMVGRILLTYASSRITNRIVADIRIDIFGRMQRFSHLEYEKLGVSSLVTRITNDAFVLMQYTEQFLRIGFITPIMVTASLFMIFVTYPPLSWLLGVTVPMLMLVIIIIGRLSRPLSEKQQRTLDSINQIGRENLTGLRVIRAFTREAFQEERFADQNSIYTATSKRLFKLMGMPLPIFLHILIWAIVLIIWFALDPVAQGQLQVGTLGAFIEYVFQALVSFLIFANLFMFYPRMMVSANRLIEVLEIPISIDENPEGITETETHGYLEFHNVTFGYPGETESPVLHNISFKAQPGETVAFIGSTGSGKSTLIQLIPRFYDVSYGQILIDGHDVKDYNLAALRKKIGFVLQKNYLFTGTIEENLRYGNESATQADMERACEIAQATEFIESTEDGYQTHLAEGGTNLSGGQKQRLSIARAIIRQPDIYVFDDSFSALDYKTDATLRQRLDEETQDATVLIVAQRVSSIMNADRIIVLDEGEMVGQGTHQELLKTNDIYRAIAESQLKPEELE